jgi:hypothetical protein
MPMRGSELSVVPKGCSCERPNWCTIIRPSCFHLHSKPQESGQHTNTGDSRAGKRSRLIAANAGSSFRGSGLETQLAAVQLLWSQTRRGWLEPNRACRQESCQLPQNWRKRQSRTPWASLRCQSVHCGGTCLFFSHNVRAHKPLMGRKRVTQCLRTRSV